MANTDSLPTITSAYVSPYDEVRVKVEPYIVHDGTRLVEVFEFLGDAGDRGGYLVGRGYMVRKDGTVGVRRIDLGSGRTPANVTAAARELFDPSDRCPVCGVSGMVSCVAEDDLTEVPDHAGRPVGLAASPEEGTR